MRAESPELMPWARSSIAILCLLLAASVLSRIHTYRIQPEGGGVVAWEAPSGFVDLGDGILLPRDVAQPMILPIESCSSSASVYFAQVSPYEPDPSLLGRPRPGDRVFYVYRGWHLGNRFINISLNSIYFSRRAYARLKMQKIPTTEDFALKFIVPSSCKASPEAVMAVLRTTLQPFVFPAVQSRG